MIDAERKTELCNDFLYNDYSPYELHQKYEVSIEDVYKILKNNGEAPESDGDASEENSF